MSFALVNHAGRELAVLLLRPNLREDGSHVIAYHAATELDVGGSGRETREPQHPDLRLRQSCSYLLRSAAEAATLRARLAALGDTPIAVPLWCDVLPGADWGTRLHTTQLLVRLSDGALLDAGAPLAPTLEYAPLLVGRLVEAVALTPLGKTAGARTRIAIDDDSPWADRVGLVAAGALGTWPAELVPASTEDMRDLSADGRDYVAVGVGRERGIEHREQAFKWGQEGAFALRSRAEIAALLGAFAVHQGRWGSFSMPWWFTPGPDVPATPHATTVRLGADKLELAFSGATTAKTKLAFWQVPWEIAPPPGEEAAQAPRAFLYRHTLRVPVSPVVWRYTDYAHPITVIEDGAEVTYFPATIEHDRITQGYMLDDADLKLTSFVADNHPWMLILRRSIQAPLEVDVFECNPHAPTASIRLRYTGEIADTPSGKGRKLTAPTSVLGGLLEIQVPSFLLQEGCNHEWCTVGCGLSLEAYTWAGTVTALSGSDVDVQIVTNPVGGAQGDDYFANGDAEIGAGLTWQSRDIIRSVALAGGQHRLSLDRAFTGLALGSTITWRPTCTGTWAECVGFGNTINYGGHRHMGPDNISVPQRETDAQGGKK